MTMLKRHSLCLIFIFSLLSNALFATELVINDNINLTEKKELNPKNTLYIELKDGIVIVELFPVVAPRHVQRIKSLTQDGFYDGLKFHRVISGFMVQTGDPTGTGRGGSSYGKVSAEFNKEHHTKGTLSMARSSDPDSANSQFFIVTGEFFPDLDNQYTVFGRVIEGMQYVDKIKIGDTSKNGVVENPDSMIKVVTGDMLGDKTNDTIKKEMDIIENMQNEKIKEDATYQKKSVLELLLQTKDIDINEVEETPQTIVNDNNTQTPSVDTQNQESTLINSKEVNSINSTQQINNNFSQIEDIRNNEESQGKTSNQLLK